jgi:type IV pilus assembly protein PilZ
MTVAITDDTPFIDEGASRSRLGRVDVKVPVHLWSDDDECVLGITQNLCIGGMFVATPRALPLGARVMVRPSILDGVEPVEIEAQVCWFRRVGAELGKPPGLGLRFVDPLIHAAMFVRLLLHAGGSSS